MLRRSLSILCFLAFFSWILFTILPQNEATALLTADVVGSRSMSAVLPVLPAQLSTLPDTLIPFLSISKLREVVIVVQQDKIVTARAIVRDFVAALEDFAHPDFRLHIWPSHLGEAAAVMHVSSHVTTEWLLVLDTNGLSDIGKNTRALLLNPPAFDLPLGPRGFLHSVCLTPTQEPQFATFLVPPFVSSRSFLYIPDTYIDSDVWLQFGAHVADHQHQAYGGIVISKDSALDSTWCSRLAAHEQKSPSVLTDVTPIAISSAPLFAVLFADSTDVAAFAPVLCSLQEADFIIFMALYASTAPQNQHVLTGSCILRYFILSDPISFSSRVRRTFARDPDVVVSTQDLHLEDAQIPWIVLSREDLAYSVWMKALTLQEWRHWHRPRVDISIITKDRPQSLTRLLNSLTHAHYYGDRLNMRINLEQSADEETMKIAQDFEWRHGSLFLHHRVIHGGLLPAVVESWYPATNNTYGLLLEDDVEVSPMFYAWIKMTILRYQYGSASNRSQQLFGISLYQQKHIELHPTGRRAFSAQSLFEAHGYPSFTPYLSQIPCSWGAVYFPAHWRLFHSYLTFRFSQRTLPISTAIVPDVRSNRWTKSWKRYFIEFAYLRGYVMLYPNFPDFVSLSTNHLEVGAHVKHKDEEKEALFMLPLMSDADPLHLLRLPDGTLPEWEDLPVLNLTGSILSLQEIKQIGHTRSVELTGCPHEMGVSQYGSQQSIDVCM